MTPNSEYTGLSSFQEKIYSCDRCDAQFKSSQSINVHKRHCALKARGLDWRTQLSPDALSRTVKKKRQRKPCPVCGMPIEPPAIKFCSTSCAAKSQKRVQKESTKIKIRNAVRKLPLCISCNICGKNFKPKFKKTKTCSQSCGAKYAFITRPAADRVYRNCGGARNGSDRNYKTGYYHGVYCSSSYELIFVASRMNLGIPVARYQGFLKFYWEGKEAKYYPDFDLSGVIHEVKGYLREKDVAKLSANPQVVLVDKKAIMAMKASDPELCKITWDRIADLYD